MSNIYMDQVNLVPRAIRSARARYRCVVLWCGAAAAVIAVVGLPGVYIGGNAALSDPAIGAQIEQVGNQLTANQNAIPELQKQLAQLQAEQEVLDLVRNRIEWRTVFTQLVNASQSDVRFTGLIAEGGGVEGDQAISIRITGVASTQTAARSYVVALESLTLFDHLELTRTARRDINDQEVIEFEIVARVASSIVAQEVTP
jgi:Tfp pilus assembly protein PilN